MPRPDCGRVHRTRTPTPSTSPSSSKMHHTRHLTWPGKRAPSPCHGPSLRREAPKHVVPLVVVVDDGSKQQGKQASGACCCGVVVGGREGE
jgi:hypothetical protein